MRTRENPVILYAHPVILGPENPKRPLRILEKKFLKKKNASTSKAQILFLATTGNVKNFFGKCFYFFTKILGDFHKFLFTL